MPALRVQIPQVLDEGEEERRALLRKGPEVVYADGRREVKVDFPPRPAFARESDGFGAARVAPERLCTVLERLLVAVPDPSLRAELILAFDGGNLS